MEDTDGAQAIDLSTPTQKSFLHLGAGEKSFELSTDGKGRIHTGDKLEVDVGGEQTHHVTKKPTETYDDLQDTTVKERREHVQGPVTETYDGHYEQKVTSGGMLRDVKGGQTDTVVARWTQNVDGGFHQKFDGGSVTLDVATGTMTIKSTAGINLMVAIKREAVLKLVTGALILQLQKFIIMGR